MTQNKLDAVSVKDAHKRIAEQVRGASTSFYWAMRLLPKERRQAIFAVYAFCREVDDIADDDDVSLEERRVGLKKWREEIDRIYQGKPSNPVGRVLSDAVATYELRKQDFIAVIDGMEMDAGTAICAPHREIFNIYCDRVACAVGRLCIYIFGQPDARGHALADTQGKALQMTNILRDVHEDAERGRLYLPMESLEEKGIFLTKPEDVLRHPAYPSVWRALASETAGWYLEAEAAMATCDPKAVRPARIMLEVYQENFKRMRQLSDHQIADPQFSMRLTSKATKLLLALRHGLF